MRLFFAASLLATAAGCATVQDSPAAPTAQVVPRDQDARRGTWRAAPAPVQRPEPSLYYQSVGENQVRNLEANTANGAGGRSPR